MSLSNLSKLADFIEEILLKHKLLMSISVSIIMFMYKRIENLISEGYSLYFEIPDLMIVKQNIIFDIIITIVVFIIARIISKFWMDALTLSEKKYTFISNTGTTYILISILFLCDFTLLSSDVNLDWSIIRLNIFILLVCLISYFTYRLQNQKLAFIINMILFIFSIWYILNGVITFESFKLLLTLGLTIMMIFVVSSLDYVCLAVSNILEKYIIKNKSIKIKKKINKNYVALKYFYIRLLAVVFLTSILIYILILPNNYRAIGNLYAKSERNWTIALNAKESYLVLRTRDSLIGIQIDYDMKVKKIEIKPSIYKYLDKNNYIFKEVKNTRIVIDK